MPWKFEAGTPDIAAAIGLGAAAEYLMDVGMDRVREHERELVSYALESARELPTSSSTARWIPTCAAGSSRSTFRASIPTTSPRSSTARGRRSGRPPLHDAAPRTARPRRDGARFVQRLLDSRGCRRPRRRAQRGHRALRRLTTRSFRTRRRRTRSTGQWLGERPEISTSVTGLPMTNVTVRRSTSIATTRFVRRPPPPSRPESCAACGAGRAGNRCAPSAGRRARPTIVRSGTVMSTERPR